jgi:Mor family transcriptional regulator
MIITTTPESIPEPYRSIAQVIGADATLELCRFYGGANLYIPPLNVAASEQRDTEIRFLHSSGELVSDLAKKYNVSKGVIRRIVSQ